MKLKVVNCISMLLVISASIAMAAPTLDEVCNLTECRSPKIVSVRVSKDQASEIHLQKALFYFQDVANVVSGETIYLEVTESKENGETLKYVSKNNNPEKTVVISLTAEEQDPKKLLTILKITNPLKKPLVYEAMIHAASGNSFQKTSVCSVGSGLSNYESWPFPIFQMALSNFKWVTEEEAKSYGCK